MTSSKLRSASGRAFAVIEGVHALPDDASLADIQSMVGQLEAEARGDVEHVAEVRQRWAERRLGRRRRETKPPPPPLGSRLGAGPRLGDLTLAQRRLVLLLVDAQRKFETPKSEVVPDGNDPKRVA